jgi:hypothetical protein
VILNRNRCAKVLPIALPFLVLTAAATGLATAAWRAGGAAAILAWVAPHSVSGSVPRAPQAAPQVPLDTAVVIETAPAPPVQAEPPPPQTPQAVDYDRLNRDVQLVTETLDRFNQKLLRMIAQARAIQAQNERAKGAASNGGPPDQLPPQGEPAPAPDPAPQPKAESEPIG